MLERSPELRGREQDWNVSRKELLLNDVVPTLHRMALRTTSRLAERLEPAARPKQYAFVAELPTDARGKLDRVAAQRLFDA